MHRHDPTKFIITLGFGSLLTLMTVLAWISLSQMDSSVDTMSRLVEETSAKSRAANAMRDFVRLQGNALTQIYLSEDALERDQLMIRMADYGLGFREALDLFEANRLSSREIKAVNRIKQVATTARLVGMSVGNDLLSGKNLDSINATLESANASRSQVITALDDLITLQNQHASMSLEDNVSYHRQTQALIIIIAATAFFIGVLISMLVIREIGRKNSAMRYQANHDALTKLVNRGAFEIRLHQALGNARENDVDHALCYLDLDQFKIINDTCGHKAGDELLKQITRVILNHVRDRDTLGRLGGDEFGLLLENCTIENALEICEGIVTIVRKHDFLWQDRCYHVGVSIGLVPVTRQTESVAKIMAEADMACYAAKDMGRNQVHMHEFEGRHVRKMQKELSWVADITSTIEAKRFLLFAQPIVPTSGKEATMMYEVLLRIRDADGSIVSPGQYLPAAERFSLMHEVDIWVTTEAIRFLSRRSRDKPDEQICLFINLSANSLTGTAFCDHIGSLLEQYPVPANSLCFEITETAAIKNIETTIEVIRHLKRLRCKFALDDFGNGMSSLAYLKNLPVNYIKIDGAIVQNIADDRISRAMAAAVNEIGRVMNIKTVAEFVETPTVFEQIKNMGIDYAQGYHISRPCPLDEIRTDWPDSKLHQL